MIDTRREDAPPTSAVIKSVPDFSPDVASPIKAASPLVRIVDTALAVAFLGPPFGVLIAVSR